MKKILHAILFLVSATFTAQTATNFNCNDCLGNNHDLFTELNSGKVIVLCWVMPCNACIVPAQNANNIVNSYSVSNPGKVKFYLCDDFGTTSCITLNNWANTNNLTNYTAFTNSLINMTDYGATGMPKIVVIGGGTNHTVYDNQNNTLNTTTFSTAINNAIAGSPTSIKEINGNPFSFELSPNPSSAELRLSFNSAEVQKMNVEIYSLGGQLVLQQNIDCAKGNNTREINIQDIANGTYFVKLSNGKQTVTNKIVISR